MICKPNNEVSLGIRDTKYTNLALLAKTCWRCLQNNDLLRAKILIARYCPKKDPLGSEMKKRQFLASERF